jgi:ketosteroid isomerase-like protein
MSQDIDELTALNRDYVASVQNGDVRRFDEILAQDFYCSNSDKSLVDRAGFLKQTALPVTIKNLIAEDVKIRVLGDFAIIHARTSYLTPDGQQAHGRYTDCWARQNGNGWRCRRMWRGSEGTTASSSRRRPGPIRRVLSFEQGGGGVF